MKENVKRLAKALGYGVIFTIVILVSVFAFAGLLAWINLKYGEIAAVGAALGIPAMAVGCMIGWEYFS